MNINEIRAAAKTYAEENYYNEYELRSFYEGVNFVIEQFLKTSPLAEFVEKTLGKECFIRCEEKAMVVGYNEFINCVIVGRYDKEGWRDRENGDRIFINSPMVRSYWYTSMEILDFV